VFCAIHSHKRDGERFPNQMAVMWGRWAGVPIGFKMLTGDTHSERGDVAAGLKLPNQAHQGFEERNTLCIAKRL